MLLEQQRLLSIEEITSVSSAEELRRDWSELWERCPRATAFQTPEWQLAWWSAFGPEKELRIFALRENATSRLIGLLPAYFTTRDRMLMFIGAGVSDELDILAEEQFRDIAAGVFLRELRTQPNVCEFVPLPESSPLARDASFFDVAPALNLADPLPASLRQNIRYYRRRAQKLGPLAFERAQEGNFDELFRALLHLHRLRWQEREQRGVLHDRDVQHFHFHAARALLRRGILRLYALRLGVNIVASFYGFLHAGRMMYYIGGFHPEFEQLSLGTLLIAHAIDEAKREQAREFTFLRGAERYKYLWGASDRRLFSLRLTHGA
ncbi:MAG: GNAT family N-acetyltransferase [Verrucomicrobia bacterium]|nr:GNAT family N-acetyltransferase [Verrucomicrobiota bacterium]